MSLHVRQRRLDVLQDALGYQFKDINLLSLALTHRSVGKANNERLEFLGDSVVNHVVAEHLYHQFPSATEGQLSRLRARLVRGTHLATLAQELQLSDSLRLGTGEKKSGGRHRQSIQADAFEAVIGAVLIDGGLMTAVDTVSRLFEASLADLDLSDERDAKTRLQEWLQGKGLPLPHYELKEVSGADHDQDFTIRCRVAPLDDAVEGKGKSRRQAEQDAAGRVLEELLSV